MARMSLSFPGLIAAVPLYAVDHGGDGSVVRHLFSDGGISSNFPMHFFDSLLPSRPTFGVDLTPPHPHHPEKTWRPDFDAGTNPRVRVIDGVGSFAGALRDAVQNWQDNRQVAQRGYADRVVSIRLDSNEGGMNLRMPEEVVLRLVARGAEAGDKLLEFDWDTHRRVRYRIATGRLTDALEQLDHAYAAARLRAAAQPRARHRGRRRHLLQEQALAAAGLAGHAAAAGPGRRLAGAPVAGAREPPAVAGAGHPDVSRVTHLT